MASLHSGIDRGRGRRRLVILGASNVARAIPTIVHLARGDGGPIDLFLAHGHGRSYGQASQVLMRAVPGILQCGLWRALAETDPGDGAADAVVTDVGNDVLYGVPVAQIADWIGACLERLTRECRSTVVTELPLAAIQSLGPARYLLARSLLFPRCRLTRQEALDRARQLNHEVRRLAQQYAVRLVQPSMHWYGVDPIHIRRCWEVDAWSRILAPAECRSSDPRRSFWPGLRLRMLRHEVQSICGLPQHNKQPAARLADGSRLFVY